MKDKELIAELRWQADIVEYPEMAQAMREAADRIEKLHKAAEAILKAADAIKDGIKPVFEHATEEIKAFQESMRKETGGGR
jgi:chromosome segregation ATPase